MKTFSRLGIAAGRQATLAAIALVVCAAIATAQTTLGRLSGTVLDSSGSVIPGATITLTNEATNQVQTMVSGDNGAYTFPQLPVGNYKVEITLEGFKTRTYTGVAIAVGQEYSLTTRLELGAVSEVVNVVAGASLVSTTSPEVNATVMQKQVLDIPLVNRDVTNLIKMQPGVQAITNRTNTSINGGRPTWTTVTLDGINIQDNFIRVNSLDFLPNRPTSDTVAEFTITTAVSGADAAGGATSVRMITPSGSNRLTGSVFEFNRDADFAANSFFNNAATPSVPKPLLSRHQFGGRAGGPIQRDKLFFFGYYEGFRQEQQPSQNLVIPANADLLDGVFRYVSPGETAVRSVNVMQLTGLPIDSRLRSELLSKFPSASNVNNFDVGNSTATRVLNTAGYRFNQTDLNNRDQYGFRFDYALSDTHKFQGIYSYFKETDDRQDLDFVSTNRPLIFTDSDAKRYSLAWRWIGQSNFQNELRGGANLAPVAFESDWDYGTNLYITPLLLTNPIAGSNFQANGTAFQPQGRFTNTYQIGDTASLMLGSHELQMGGSWQRNHVNPYNFAGRFPTVTFGFSAIAPASVQLQSAQFPGGISAAELANANALASFLGGTISSVAQTFQVRDQNSGFVSGIPSNENYTLDNIAAYVQDNWRWKPNFTVRAGLKWEYYSPLKEDDNLGFLPILNQPFNQVMLDPAARVTFVDGDFYNKDLNNFGPTAGFAWDVTKDGKTAVRGGYSLTFVNEETVTVGRAAGRGNPGLMTPSTTLPQYTTVSAGVPVVPTPAFLTTRTMNDQMATSAIAVLWGIDPSITSPYVHQISIGVQRELGWSTALEARYVGTFGREIWRGTDFNQMQISPEFLADFNRARSNGFLAQQAGLAYNPNFNASVPGSQPLTVLPSFGATLLTNSAVVTNLQTNQVAALADFYIQQRVPGALATFMPNGGIYASQAIANGGFSDYNALQLELRRQFRNGFFAQVNYTFSDTKTDSAGTAQNRFEAFMDNLRPELNTGRSQFHVTHVTSANAIYELPFGHGRRWFNSSGLADAIIGGWQIAPVFAWQSGSPISITSARGTFNRVGRSNCLNGDPIGCNTAFSTLSPAQIKNLLGIHKVGDKIYWIDPSVIGSDGRAVGADNLANTAGFPGQVFFNPAAGAVGNLPILVFDGPSQFRIDLALSKRIRLTDRYRIEVKGEGFNLTNTPSFLRGDMDINSTTFGRLTQVNVASRVIQLSVRFDF
jgi:Carboxypeptidase regulatory-like domain/TonB dependent receptor-like, beta-barrel